MDTTQASQQPTAPQQQATAPKSPFSFTVLFRNAWNLYRSRLKTLLLVQLVMTVIILAVTLVATLYGLGSALLFFGSVSTTPTDGALSSGAFWGSAAALFFLGAVAFLFLTAWQLASLLTALHNNQPTAGSALSIGFRKLPRTAWVLLLTVILVTVGFILLFIPGVYALIVLSFAIPVVVLEGIGGTGALKQSREYVKGNWWNIFFVLLIFGIIVGLADFILGSLVGIAESSALDTIYSAVYGLFVTPLSASFSYVLYRTARTLKGGPPQM